MLYRGNRDALGVHKGSTLVPMAALGVPGGDAGVSMGAAGRPRGAAGIFQVSNRLENPINQVISSVAVAQWGLERSDLHL